MSPESPTLEPIYVSVKVAAKTLGVSVWTVYQRLGDGLIESRLDGGRRLVSVQSLKDYAERLPLAPTKGKEAS